MASFLEIVIKAKNLMAKGVKAATQDMHVLGKRADEITGRMIDGFAKAAAGVIAVGAAAISAGAAAVKAHAESEKAENDLAAAIAAHGGAIDQILPKRKALADAIQDQTGIDDEATLGLITLITNMGVAEDKIEATTKAALGLSKALGMDQAAAAKAAALALEGNYSALERYVPALKLATDEGQRQAIVQQLLEGGWQQQQANLSTIAGQYELLKGRVGNFLEAIGKVIAENVQVQDGMAAVSEKIKAAQVAFEDWANSGGLDMLIMDVKKFANEVNNTFLNTVERIKGIWANLDPILAAPFRYFGTIVGTSINAAVAEFNYFSDLVSAVMEKTKRAMNLDFSEVAFPSRAEANAAEKAMYKSYVANPFRNTSGAGDSTASKIAANDEATIQRNAEITAEYEKAAQERANKDLQRKKEQQAAGSIQKLVGVQEGADEETITVAAEKKTVAAADVSTVERDLDATRIEENLQRELANVDVVAKARASAETQLGGGAGGGRGAIPGESISAESIKRDGLINTMSAREEEAKRISAMVEAMESSPAQQAMQKSLQKIEEHTGLMAAQLNGAISMGAGA